MSWGAPVLWAAALWTTALWAAAPAAAGPGDGGREAALLARDLRQRVVVRSTAPGDAAFIAERLRASLESAMARDLGRGLVRRRLRLDVEFGQGHVRGLWGSVDLSSGATKVILVPAVRLADAAGFGRVFWHEACHALTESQAQEAGLYLWDLFFDDELYCYLAGDAIALELGAAPESDEISLAMEASTAAFKDAMAAQEETGALCWEDLPDPMNAWRRRLQATFELKAKARRVLSRVPVWRYRIRKVVAAGLIPEERLRSISFELDENERTYGGLEGVLHIEAALRRRLDFFSTGPGPGHLENLSKFLATLSLPGRLHRDMVRLQSRYKALAARRRSGPMPEPVASEGPPPQATWDELTKAYDLLVARDPACCKDEPSYEKESAPAGPPGRD